MNVKCYHSFLEQPISGYFSIDLLIYIYILSGLLVLGLYLILILKIFISEGHIDDNFLYIHESLGLKLEWERDLFP